MRVDLMKLQQDLQELETLVEEIKAELIESAKGGRDEPNKYLVSLSN